MGNLDEVTIDDSKKLCEDISSLFLQEKFSDIVFTINEEKLHAHKAILAARSEHFESVLTETSSITISDVSAEAFKKILKYIYTGAISLPPSNINLCVEVMSLAHQYFLQDLNKAITEQAKSTLNLKNVCAIFNTATAYNLQDLRDACLTFMDEHASEIVASDCFNDLSQTSMIKLLQRDSFFAPEIEIFKKVALWCQNNNDVDNLVIECVRLSLLTVVDIVATVWPTKLVDNGKLLQAIAEIVDVKPKTTNSRRRLVVDKNVATAEFKAEVISGINTNWLLNGNRDRGKHADHAIDGKETSNITIKFGNPFVLNHIHLMLWDGDQRYYHYYIEVSNDKKRWKKIVDYTHYPARSVQNLYFASETATYVRITGTHNTAHAEFHLIYFEAYFNSHVPKVVNGISSPTTNVATPEKKAVVIEGISPNALLDGVSADHSNYTYHKIGAGSIVIQLAQPYLISSMKFRLWDKDDRVYKYYIEVSSNKSEWVEVVDRRNVCCKSWQVVNFSERIVVFIRITGTHNSIDTNYFHLMHFECPASGD